MARLRPTLIDYVVIAINPALIMVLIGSLVYFLLEMFYQGQYPERLHYCLTLFIFAAVLVSRISMEEGWDRAAMFGIVLTVAILLAMQRFVHYEGTQVAAIGWLINCGLIALAWWCAAKLTWDCTLIDESQDASGEGLLQTVGLDSAEKETAENKKEDGSARSEPRGETRKKPKSTPTTPPADSILPPEPDSKAGESWWQRFVERRRRPHAPGVWVVYYSLAALPMFGLGQAFIPTSNSGSRRYAFALLCVYVASALGLLLTTSFLSLRRYLRQRRLEMPAPMAGVWLTIGAVLIVCLLLLTALLPRPNAEYEISQLPFEMTSEQHDSSRVAVGNEGVKDENAKSATGDHTGGTNRDSQPDKSQNQNGSADGKDPKSDGGKSKTEASKSDDSKSDKSSSGESKSDDPKPAAGKSGESKSEESKSNEPKSGESKPDSAKSNKSADDSKDRSQGNGGRSNAPAPKSFEPPGTPPKPNLSLAFNTVADLLKWVFYGAVVVAALVWLFFHWRTVLDWLQALLNGWRDLWQMLFGRRQAAEDAASAESRRKSFAEYLDPFASGLAGRWSPGELVRYSFEAFEAWARDHDWPREPDQTVYEFAVQIAGHVEQLASPARTLAELYSWAAYSPRTLPASSTEHVRAFWQVLLRADRDCSLQETTSIV
ncbi:MAG TPA: DUF4129 domain-containing protein [Pirellulales bacterium]|jgi:hypothetical protein|nr:DUF4129 domain-containing protein [Pirellulales bacterium]